MAPAPSPLRFGTDGVRGVAYEDLTVEAVESLGHAAARVIGVEQPFLVARDTRESGPDLEAAIERGIAGAGGEAESLDVFPTPGLAYLSQARGWPAAMISASHNRYRDNGIKLFAPGGRKLPDHVEAQIEAAMIDPDGDSPEPLDVAPARDNGAGRDEYLEHLLSVVEGEGLEGLRIVLDCAHGAAVETAPAAFERLGAHVVVVGAEPDGRNINEGVGSTHPQYLQQQVEATGADVGLAFDGDADRVIAVDERGELIDGDHIIAVAALDLRSRGKLHQDTVVTTVMANLGFRNAMEAHGIHVVQTRVGDRYVLEAMDEGGYSLGGEQSGHIIFRDLTTTGDGVLSGLVLLDVMARSGRKLSELAGVVTKLPQILTSVRVAERERLDEAQAFWSQVRAVEEHLGESGRVLVRPSGTEPVVRVMVEAPTQSQAQEYADQLAEAVVKALGRAEP